MEHFLKENKIGIVGLGYVGLPLALTFLEKGFEITGVDVDNSKVQLLTNGKSYLNDLSNEEIAQANSTNRFEATTAFSALKDAEAIIICVPTPLTATHEPDLSYLEAAGREISKHLSKGQLVVLESSTYPGTTKEVLLPALEHSGMKAGKDFYIGYSPERIDPGNKSYSIDNIPKIISGYTTECLNIIEKIYSQVFSKLVRVSSMEIAELTKLVENCHRLINISFINELAILCDSLKINIWEVIDAASTKPYGFTAFYPGPGIGGHCIPVDPLYLQWKVKQMGIDSQFIQLAMAVNEDMPTYVVRKMKETMEDKPLKGSNVLIYGVTYKPDVNDIRESTALTIMELLDEEGAKVNYHDPYVPELTINQKQFTSVELTKDLLANVDSLVILTNHRRLPIKELINQVPYIFDTRNVTKGLKGKAKIVQLGGGMI